MKTLRALTLGFALFLLATLCAHAATDTWDGGGGDDSLSTNNNWADNTAPASDLANTDLIFAGSVRLTPNLSASFSAKSVTFNNTAGAFAIHGNPLGIGAGGIVNNDADTQTFDNGIHIDVPTASFNAVIGGLTFTNAVSISVNALSLDGAGAFSFLGFGGSGTVTKNGAGTMTSGLVGTNEFHFVINAGTVNTLADGETDSFSFVASIAVNGTSILNLNENTTLANAPVLLTRATGAVINIAAGKTLTVQNGADVVITGAFTNSTASTMAVTGAGSTFSTTSTLALVGGSIVNVTAGGDMSAGAGTVNVGTSGNGTVTVDGIGSSLSGGTLNVALNGATGSVGFSNAGTGTFTGINVDASGVIGTSGTLSIQSGSDVTGSGMLIANSAVANTGTVTITGTNSVLTLSGSANATIGAASASAGSLNVSSAGTFNSGLGLTTVNTTGTIAITSGTYNSNGNLTINGGKLTRNSPACSRSTLGKRLPCKRAAT